MVNYTQGTQRVRSVKDDSITGRLLIIKVTPHSLLVTIILDTHTHRVYNDIYPSLLIENMFKGHITNPHSRVGKT